MTHATPVALLYAAMLTSCVNSAHVAEADGGAGPATDGSAGSEAGGTVPEGSAADVGVDGASFSDWDASCFIDTSKYDHTCTTDSDCISSITLNYVNPDSGLAGGPFNLYLFSGNYCKPTCDCQPSPVQFIGKNALTQLTQDVSKTPLGSGGVALEICSCPMPAVPQPICQHGYCGGFVGGPPDTGVGSE